MQSIRFHALHSPRRGFSLIELGIVITVIGILISSIWVYTGQVNENTRRQQLTEQLSLVVNNIRSLYADQPSICGAPNKLTAMLAQQNAIPSMMVGPGAPTCTNVSGVCVESPWGAAVAPTNGSFAVESGMPSPPGPAATAPGGGFTHPCGAAIARQIFTVELRGLPISSCTQIVPDNSGAGGPSGLQDVIINGTSVMLDATTTHTLPVQVADAVAKCVAGPNTVDFVYRLRAAAF